MFLSAVLPVAQAYVSETALKNPRSPSGLDQRGKSVRLCRGPALSGGIYALGRALDSGGIAGAKMSACRLFVAALFGLPVCSALL
jgi:hypothetical protein